MSDFPAYELQFLKHLNRHNSVLLISSTNLYLFDNLFSVYFVVCLHYFSCLLSYFLFVLVS